MSGLRFGKTKNKEQFVNKRIAFKNTKQSCIFRAS